MHKVDLIVKESQYFTEMILELLWAQNELWSLMWFLDSPRVIVFFLKQKTLICRMRILSNALTYWISWNLILLIPIVIFILCVIKMKLNCNSFIYNSFFTYDKSLLLLRHQNIEENTLVYASHINSQYSESASLNPL